VVVVTGVTSGIGRALVAPLLDRGAVVVGCARDGERLDLVARQLRPLQVIACDVRDPVQRAALVHDVMTRYGRIDVLVDNAGVGYVGTYADMTWGDLERLIATNVAGSMDLARLVLPQMLARGDGDLLMMSSVAAWAATPPLTAYAATKHAVDGFVEGVRREVHHRGVRVHSVNPAFVRSEFHARALHQHPAEDQPGLRAVPGIAAERVAAVSVRLLERGRGRTVAVPRWMGVARLEPLPPIGPVLDLLTGANAERLARAGRRLALRRAAR
jgi:short-subunit dehydrogenase